jgi:hypothetical protein
MNWKNGLLFVVGAVLISATLLLTSRDAAQGQGGVKMGGGALYTVVATDGSHVIVTDNTVNKLYFYAIDKDGKIGDELKLRGAVDLREVGKPSIKPIDAKPQK